MLPLPVTSWVTVVNSLSFSSRFPSHRNGGGGPAALHVAAAGTGLDEAMQGGAEG